jgi:phage protein D
VTRSASDLPDFEIRVNGAPLPIAARSDVRAVTVEESVGSPSWFTVELSNWDEEKLQVAWSDGSLFAVGGAVDINLGYVDSLTKVMQAEITSLEPVFTADSPPTLVVGGYGHAHRLARGRKTRSFLKMKDSAIAAQVAREAGLRADVTDTKVALPYVVQANQTDWAFLRERAARIGHEVFVRDKVLHFRPAATAGAAKQTLQLGSDITDFRPRLSGVGQVGEVIVRGWDVKTKKEVVGKAATGQERSAMGATSSGPKTAKKAFGKAATIRVDLAPGSKAEADQMALGEFNDIALGFVRATVECGGQPGLQAGSVVRIEGAGTRFSGPYYVTTVTHVLDSTGFRTTLAAERSGA